MQSRDIDSGNLGTEKARAEFRRAHYDYLYQAAIGVSGSDEMAEKLTEKLFTMMEASFGEKELPYGVELYMLSRLHRLYAEESPMKNYPPVAEKAAEAPQAAEDKASQVTEENTSQAAEEKVEPVPTTGNEAPVADKSEIASPGASTHRRRRAQIKGVPVQSAVRGIPIADAVPAEMVRPMIIRLPGGTQTYYAPQSFLVQPLYPTEGAPVAAAQPAQAEAEGPSPSEAHPPESHPAPAEASYDPSLTEFWLPKAEKNSENQLPSSAPKPVAPAPQPIAPVAKPAAMPVPPPPSQTREETREQEELRMRRSVPLTIVNTFLFLGLLTAIAYLLMELGLLPKLF